MLAVPIQNRKSETAVNSMEFQGFWILDFGFWIAGRRRHLARTDPEWQIRNRIEQH
jgi:hypothetical protein